jgi:hypothetical protein
MTFHHKSLILLGKGSILQRNYNEIAQPYHYNFRIATLGSRKGIGNKELEASIKFCPMCHGKNAKDAMVCISCGASLDEKKYDTTKNDEIEVTYSEKPEELYIDEAIIPKQGIAVYFAETTKPFVVRTDKEFIIGRSLIPTTEAMLNLSDFDGFRMGLSRRHAMVRQAGTGYEIIDLSSTNGTWLNGERLIPYTPYPLPSSSRLLLSRIRLVVFYHPKKER